MRVTREHVGGSFSTMPVCEAQGFWSQGHERACAVAQSCPTLCDPVDCSPPGSSVHGISQARILGWIALSSSRGSSRPGDHTRVSCTAGRFFTTEPLGKSSQGHRRGLFTRLNLSYPLLSGCSSLLSSSLNFQSLRSFTPMESEASWLKAGKPDG